MFLLDTVVLSELRKRDRHPGVVDWLCNKPVDDIYLSAVTIGEIECGITRQRVKDPAFAEKLDVWLDRTLRIYADRILPITTLIARRWGALSGRIGHDGADLLIAATALEYGFTVVTRNTRHFEPTGVALINPFE